jgi:hypothetical protein
MDTEISYLLDTTSTLTLKVIECQAGPSVINNQQYKLIEYTNGDQKLYDLINNSQEMNELLSSAVDYSDILTELKAELDKIR